MMMIRPIQIQNRLLGTPHVGTFRNKLFRPSNCQFSVNTKTPPRFKIEHSTFSSRRRWLSTVERSSSVVAESKATPPLAVRAALVATTTAIATPACPVVFVVNAGLRYVVFDSQTRHAILGATTVIGGIYTLVHFATFDLLPIAYSYGQLFLPFAIVNGGLAGTAYLGMDLVLGTARVASLPWTGAAMGAFVGFVGPVSGLYDVSFQWFYDIPEAEGFWSWLLNNQFMLPLSIATGTAVGGMMHPLLYYPIVGIQGIHWAAFSAPLLAAATLLTASLYAGDYYNSSIFPPETYLTTDESRGLMLVSRFHAKHLQVEDWGPQVGYQPLGTGVKARESVMAKLEATKQGDSRTDMVFDSRRKAWLHYVTNGLFGDDYAIDTIPSQIEMKQKGLRYLPSDGVVAFMMLQGGQLRDKASSVARESLTQLASDLQVTNRRYKRSSNKAKVSVDRIELASHGIALLFTRQELPDAKERELKRLEQNIRKVVPGILLYKKEEGEGTQGCSVESQLEAFGWTGIQNDELKHQSMRLWKSGLHQVLSTEQAQANARHGTLAVTGLCVVLLFGLFSKQ